MSEGTLLIRADANVAMGTGHVMRCLALAQTWQDRGGRPIFVMAETTAAVESRLLREGMQVERIPAAPGTREDAKRTADIANQNGSGWIVVDGYHFGADYQAAIKRSPCKLLFVDDNGHAEHYYADLVLNQNPPASESLYSKREPYTQMLLGPRYAMLRREFWTWREWKREIPAIGRKILISMGGSDPDNITLPVVEALGRVRIEGLEVTVVLGGSSPHVGSVKRAAAQFAGALELQHDAPNMPELMAWADVAVIAAGGTLWELLFMGCSVLSYSRDAFQGQIISELQRDGLVGDLEDPRNFDAVSLSTAIEELAGSFERRTRMSLMGRKRIDGGGADRICELLMNRGSTESPRVILEPVLARDHEIFLAMAARYFQEINPDFVPQEDWEQHYWNSILKDARLSLRWVAVDGDRVGFILYGIEEHRFLPRLIGVIYELYVSPTFRHRGIARICAEQAIRELQNHSPSKVQLEIMEGNLGAEGLWKSLGFAMVAERWVLGKTRG